MQFHALVVILKEPCLFDLLCRKLNALKARQGHCFFYPKMLRVSVPTIANANTRTPVVTAVSRATAPGSCRISSLYKSILGRNIKNSTMT